MKTKTITYYLAVVIAAIAAFAVTPAGQALIAQYPKLSIVFAIIGALGALFHNPKAAAAILLFLALCSPGFAQTPVPPTQHFVMSTMAGSYGGSTVSIAATGIQLIQQPSYAVSVAYEFISNPADSSKPRVGSGIANVTVPASKFVPAAVRSKLLVDLSNYNVTFQGGAGRESVSNGVGLPRTSSTVGNFGIFGSYPLPGGHVQVGVGYKWITGSQGGLIKVPAGQLNFTF
jgi:hypothetical protein